jgi:hypothetical protein
MTKLVDDMCGGAREGVAVGFTALAAVLTGIVPAAAEPMSPMTSGFLGMPTQSAPPVERFVTPGGDGFVLDRSGPAPLVLFEGDNEVLALRSTPGPRGDEILKTDTGHVLLRMTNLGGVTVYPQAGSSGAPATPLGAARPLAMPPPPPGGLAAKLSALSASTSKKLGRPVMFTAQSVPNAISGVAANAAQMAADVLDGGNGDGINRVLITPGAAAAAFRQGDTLRVIVAAPLGYAGRPSGAKLTAAAR